MNCTVAIHQRELEFHPLLNLPDKLEYHRHEKGGLYWVICCLLLAQGCC